MNTTILALDLGTTHWVGICCTWTARSPAARSTLSRSDLKGAACVSFFQALAQSNCSRPATTSTRCSSRKFDGTLALMPRTPGGFMGHLTAWCEHHNIPYQAFRSARSRSTRPAKGNAGKGRHDRVRPACVVTPQSTTTEADALALLHWAVETQEVDMKVPTPQYRCPSVVCSLQATDLDAIKERGWRDQHILVVNASDERLDFIEREIVRRIGDRLYGGRRND